MSLMVELVILCQLSFWPQRATTVDRYLIQLNAGAPNNRVLCGVAYSMGLSYNGSLLEFTANGSRPFDQFRMIRPPSDESNNF